MANAFLNAVRDIERGARGIKPNSDKAINAIQGFFGKAYSVLDYPINKLASEGGETVAKKLAKEGAEYTWGNAARFGMQTYMMGSAAGRVLSGGGIYKDSNGNSDLIGIPFI